MLQNIMTQNKNCHETTRSVKPNLTLDMVSQTVFHPTHGSLCRVLYPNLTLNTVSHTKQKSTNPWIIVSCTLTLPNPGYGQSDRTEVHQPMDYVIKSLNHWEGLFAPSLFITTLKFGNLG
jgi:hypothetical protein